MRYKNSWDLKYWESGEYQVVRERLSDLTKLGISWHPTYDKMFKILDLMEPEDVKVAIFGQDPYPQRSYATGIPFSIPKEQEKFPPSLAIMFKELERDLKVSFPNYGNLLPWVHRGVLLFNVRPTVSTGKPLSHNWNEYDYLIWEILDKLANRNIVVATLGSVARNLMRPCDYDNFPILSVAHPSPRAELSARNPFSGSRFFSSINSLLTKQGVEPIDWRLP